MAIDPPEVGDAFVPAEQACTHRGCFEGPWVRAATRDDRRCNGIIDLPLAVLRRVGAMGLRRARDPASNAERCWRARTALEERARDFGDGGLVVLRPSEEVLYRLLAEAGEATIDE